MQYNSIGEYFSRLQNRTLIIFFTTVLMFLVLFYLLMTGFLTPVMSMSEGAYIVYVLVAAAFIDGFTSFFLVKMLLLKSLHKPSLGERMDSYAQVSLVRSFVLSSGSLMIMMALYLTNWPWLLMIYSVYLLFFLLSWPSRSRLVAELKLKPSEQEVIMGN